MINRLLNRPGYPDHGEDDDEPYGEFYLVRGAFGTLMVTPTTAAVIEALLDRTPAPPPWIIFRDRAGSRVRVRACDVYFLVESTAAQRAADRRIDRARAREEEAAGEQ